MVAAQVVLRATFTVGSEGGRWQRSGGEGGRGKHRQAGVSRGGGAYAGVGAVVVCIDAAEVWLSKVCIINYVWIANDGLADVGVTQVWVAYRHASRSIRAMVMVTAMEGQVVVMFVE